MLISRPLKPSQSPEKFAVYSAAQPFIQGTSDSPKGLAGAGAVGMALPEFTAFR